MNKNLNTDYTVLLHCLCCQSNNLQEVIDLGDQPLANSFHDNTKELPKYPLRLNVCKDCWHTQLSIAVNPDLLFKDYKYVSGTTQTLKDYFDWFALMAIDYCDLTYSTNKYVLDIGCNDGSQLNPFKDLGWNTYGIDPAENIIPITSKNHIVKCGYFQDGNHFGSTKFDIIIAQNVFAHTLKLTDFLYQCSNCLKDTGCIFIQVSQADMIEKNEFDTIYHEHISFFNVNSFINLLDQFNEKNYYGDPKIKLVLQEVIKTPIHGNSLIFVLAKDEELKQPFIDNELSMERNKGLYDINTYINYANNIKQIKEDLHYNLTRSAQINGYTIVGYGAAAKGMTALNYFNIPVKIEYIIDDAPMKQGLYTPGLNIPVVPIETLKTFGLVGSNKILFIPLAWNFFEEIKTRIKAVRNSTNDRFLKYFPKVEIK